MNFKDIRYILAISEAGTISDAAQRLGLTQSSLSRFLQRLEREYNLQLFDRSSKRLEPTEAGMKYLDSARQMLPLLNSIEELSTSTAANSKPPAIGITAISSFFPLKETFQQLFSEHPIMWDISNEEAFLRLTHGLLDLVLTDSASAEQFRQFGSYVLMKKAFIELVIPSRNFYLLANQSFSIQHILLLLRQQENPRFDLIGTNTQTQLMRQSLSALLPNAVPVECSNENLAVQELLTAGYYALAPSLSIRKLKKQVALTSLPLGHQYMCPELTLMFRKQETADHRIAVALEQMVELFSMVQLRQ